MKYSSAVRAEIASSEKRGLAKDLPPLLLKPDPPKPGLGWEKENNNQLSIINYQLSIINYQLTLNYKLLTINY